MEANKSNENNHENLEDDVKKAVENEQNIREKVRLLTINALTEGKLDPQAIRQVISLVIKGAGSGAAVHGNLGKDKLTKAIAGLDDALCSTAEASKLAIEETSLRVKKFTKEDLKQAIDDLNALEEIYLDTLKEAAKESSEALSETLKDLAKHGRLCGTAVGDRATEIIKQLNYNVGNRVSETVISGADSALQVTSNLASAAAGFLDAIAQTLDTKEKDTKKKSPSSVINKN